jgi:hypothetical protein
LAECLALLSQKLNLSSLEIIRQLTQTLTLEEKAELLSSQESRKERK